MYKYIIIYICSPTFIPLSIYNTNTYTPTYVATHLRTYLHAVKWKSDKFLMQKCL